MYCPRIVIPPLPFLFVAIANAAYTCVDFMVPMSFTAESFPLTFPEFQNHYQSVAFLTALAGRDALPSPVGSPVNISLDLNVAAQFCSPKGVKSPKVVQVLTHGLGFDHTYWNFGGPDSEYNYIKSAAEAGYATLSYDRVGTGKSTFENPYTEGQLGVEVTVAATLTTLLREGKLSSIAKCHIPTPKKVVHVGHSFGSLITGTLAGSVPDLSDGIVLTGYSTDPTAATGFAISTNFHLASEAIPDRFAGLSTGYLTWADELANQFAFFYYPNFDPAVLAAAEANKMPFALGEVLSPYNLKQPAWNGPLLVSLCCFVIYRNLGSNTTCR